MRTAQKALWNAVAITATTGTDPFRFENMDGASIQLTIAAAGDIVGTAEIQVSNDYGGRTGVTSEWVPNDTAAATITNWTTLGGSSQTVNGTTGSPFVWNLNGGYYRWFRLLVTRSSGTTSTMTALVFAKGPQ